MTIYLHQRKNGTEKRLIRTSHPSRAMAYVSKSEFTCAPATAETVVELMQQGIKVEDADSKSVTIDMFVNGAPRSKDELATPTYEEAGGE